MSIEKIVAEFVSSASDLCLEQIVDHGIHNITNNFHGESEAEYDLYAEEFKRQAAAELNQRFVDSNND